MHLSALATTTGDSLANSILAANNVDESSASISAEYPTPPSPATFSLGIIVFDELTMNELAVKDHCRGSGNSNLRVLNNLPANLAGESPGAPPIAVDLSATYVQKMMNTFAAVS